MLQLGFGSFGEMVSEREIKDTWVSYLGQMTMYLGVRRQIGAAVSTGCETEANSIFI